MKVSWDHFFDVSWTNGRKEACGEAKDESPDHEAREVSPHGYCDARQSDWNGDQDAEPAA